jgi:endo-1,4-beta-xylanase
VSRHTVRLGAQGQTLDHFGAHVSSPRPVSTAHCVWRSKGHQRRGNADITVGVRLTGSVRETPTLTTRSIVCVTPTDTIGTVCKVSKKLHVAAWELHTVVPVSTHGLLLYVRSLCDSVTRHGPI